MDNIVSKYRIFVEDNELEIKYSALTTNDILQDVLKFISMELKKRYSSHETGFKQVEDDQIVNITQIICKNIKHIYVYVPCKPDLKINKGLHQRQVRDVFDLTTQGQITLQKFKDVDVAKEKVVYSIGVIRQLLKVFEKNYEILQNDQQNHQKQSIPTPSIKVNDQQVQKQSTYTPNYIANDDNPNDIYKRKKDFQKTGGAGGSYEFVKESQKQKQVEIKGYTLLEVAQHDQPHDCWTVYQGKVYDITNYIRYHPGGQKILLGAGKDCTALFTKYHSWVNATFLLQKYQVGYVVFK